MSMTHNFVNWIITRLNQRIKDYDFKQMRKSAVFNYHLPKEHSEKTGTIEKDGLTKLDISQPGCF